MVIEMREDNMKVIWKEGFYMYTKFNMVAYSALDKLHGNDNISTLY